MQFNIFVIVYIASVCMHAQCSGFYSRHKHLQVNYNYHIHMQSRFCKPGQKIVNLCSICDQTNKISAYLISLHKKLARKSLIFYIRN